MKKISSIPLVFFIICALIFPFRLIQMVSIFVITIYFLSFVISMLMYHSISILRNKATIFCLNGSKEFSTMTVTNKGIFPLENIIIKDQRSGTFIDSLLSRNKKDYSTPLNTRIRGCYKIGPVVISGNDPLNFFPWEKTFFLYSEVIVYPAYYPLELLLTEGERGGVQKIKNPLYEDLSELKSIREFRPGDSLKRINWKATARAGKIQTMEFSDTLSAPLFILLDINPEHYPLKQRYVFIERAIEAAASLITTYSEKKESCGLISNGSPDSALIPSGKGYKQSISILENLAKIDLKTRNEKSIIHDFLNTQTSLPSGTHIYLLTPRIDKKLFNEIYLLRRKKYLIKVVLTGGEISQRPPEYCDFYAMTSYGRKYFEES
ncbi:MAG: DUF58 domain-containing protein [Spirochaetaceae bacterium]|jgi:uncharacterized protein (DUF58 family)|nr:DUF58 domain-containing protein [Spirochaetaceae bacterium]